MEVGRTARDKAGERYGRDGKVQQMARAKVGNFWGWYENVGRTARGEAQKRYGRDRNFELAERKSHRAQEGDGKYKSRWWEEQC